MHINAQSHVTLEEGETFQYEERTEDNLFRRAVFMLDNGNIVIVQRSYVQIGPCITKPDGEPLDTTVIDGKVVEYTDQLKAEHRARGYALIGKPDPLLAGQEG